MTLLDLLQSALVHPEFALLSQTDREYIAKTRDRLARKCQGTALETGTSPNRQLQTLPSEEDLQFVWDHRIVHSNGMCNMSATYTAHSALLSTKCSEKVFRRWASAKYPDGIRAPSPCWDADIRHTQAVLA